MTLIKNAAELELMKKSGEICARALKKVLANVEAGVTCLKLDEIAEDEIKRLGGLSSFKTVEDYQWTICATINDQVVHGIPNERTLTSGDIVGIDIGAIYQGYHSDMATTIPVGTVSEQVLKFLAIGQKTLKDAIFQVKIGNRIGDVSAVIQEGVEGAGYSVVKTLTGHGIGRQLHEEPYVPGVGRRGKGLAILENMVLAIEVIYAEGSGEVQLANDGWTIKTRDGSLGGLFEQTVAVTSDGPIVLTPYL